MDQRPIFPRLTAALADRYDLVRELGEGGMATVYLAEDLKHSRRVAIKVLKPELAAVVGSERFLSEIRTTANLQHPHILPLHDSGEADGFLFYVMPYVEGASLREKLDTEKQLRVDEAIDLTRKVADALDYAHGKGVVHRDIKPANILLSERGEPLVADFGIALAVSQAGGGRITETGLSLGTPYYMSPEQATGDRDVDPRSDVYALGCVLYELLAGQPPFHAPTAQAVLARILTERPRPVTDLRQTVRPHVAAVLACALEKLPADRFESAAAFVQALDDPGFTYSPAAEAPGTGAAGGAAQSGKRSAARLGWPLAAAALAGLAVWGWLGPSAPSATAPPTRSVLDLGDIVVPAISEVLVSPDGSKFAVIGDVDGQRAVFWRNAGDESFQRIPGTEGDPRFAAFSDDSQWLVYADGGSALTRVALSGGAPRPIVPSGDIVPRDPHWGDSELIVFVGQGGTGLYVVPEAGGTPRLLQDSITIRSPRLLPGGDVVIGTDVRSGSTVIVNVDDGSSTELLAGAVDATFIDTGHLLFADASGSLWAVAFDPSRVRVLGEPVPVLDGLTTARRHWARYSVSRNGTLVYGTGGTTSGYSPIRQLVLLDLEGKEEVSALPPGMIQGPRWSPDGASVTYQRSDDEDDGVSQIWTYNVALHTAPRQVTFEGTSFAPVWSPDGTRIAFASFRDGTDAADIFVKNVTENSEPRRVVSLPQVQVPLHWPSEDVMAFEHDRGLWTLDPSAEDAEPTEYLTSPDRLTEIRVSPSGELAAYQAGGQLGYDLFVRSFPDAGARELIATQVGGKHFWSPDGETLYFWQGGFRTPTLMAARIERGPPFVVTRRDSLFTLPVDRDDADLHPDGDRIVTTRGLEPVTETVAAEPSTERHFVVTNWFQELRDRMGDPAR